MKQVIVIRADLNMRKGKMVAQGSHASLGAALNTAALSENKIREWRGNKHGRKICVYVKTEKELLDLCDLAKESKLTSYLVKDIGLTEFKEPTYTALCIGPDEDFLIDKITGHLPLL